MTAKVHFKPTENLDVDVFQGIGQVSEGWGHEEAGSSPGMEQERWERK
jgi:hypothetical protein